jgi:flagellar basal body-associated protein FliL
MRPRKSGKDELSEMGTEAVAGKRRSRDGRGLGPFSGAQLTVIIVAIAVMILLPVGAFAVVSGSNVFVTDAVTGKQQKVNAAGQAQVEPQTLNVLIASGTTSVDAFMSSPIFTDVTVSHYRAVRLFIGESGAAPTSQTATVTSSLVPFVLDSFVMNTNDITRYYEVPGYKMSLSVLNGTADPATFTWRLYGRTN